MSATKTLIIVPVLNDARSLAILIRELAKELQGWRAVSLLVVDDGSLPPIDIVKEVDAYALPGQVITLSRNLGHQRAIAIGLAYAVGEHLADMIVIMDADGEDSPHDVPRLLAVLESASNMSIAVAKRSKRSEGVIFRMFYRLYRLLFRVLTGYRISFGNFSAMPMSAAQRLVAMSELWVSLPATILRSRLPINELPTERGQRYRDDPRMKLVSLMVLGFGAVAAFVENALARMILAAMSVVTFGVLASIVALALKLAGRATPGWVTTVIGVSLILMVGVATLSFVGLALSILAGVHTVPAPNALYKSFIARVWNFPARSMHASANP